MQCSPRVSGDSAGGNMAMATVLRLMDDTDASQLPELQLMALFYPSLQGFDFRLPSYITYGKEGGPNFCTSQVVTTFLFVYAYGSLDYVLSAQCRANMHTSPALKKSKYASYVSRSLLPDRIQAEVKDQTTDTDFGNQTLSDELEEMILNKYFAPLMASDEDLARFPVTYVMNAEYDALRDEGHILHARLLANGVKSTHRNWDGLEHGFLSHIGVYESSKKAIYEFGDFLKNNL
jgi:acetyl esterase/lipase